MLTAKDKVIEVSVGDKVIVVFSDGSKRCDTASIRYKRIADVIHAGGRCVARMFAYEARNNMVAQYEARLIVAAPEMYEALKSLRSQYVNAMRLLGRDVEKDGNPYLPQVDAAIAKAEGKS